MSPARRGPSEGDTVYRVSSVMSVFTMMSFPSRKF